MSEQMRPPPPDDEPHVTLTRNGLWGWSVHLITSWFSTRHIGNRWTRERAERLGRQALHEHLNPPPGPEVITIRAQDL